MLPNQRVKRGEPITADFFNKVMEGIRRCLITSVAGGRLTQNPAGGTTLVIPTHKGGFAPRIKGDADVAEGDTGESAATPKARSVESENKKGRIFSLFEFQEPSSYTIPTDDKGKPKNCTLLVRDNNGTVPTLRYADMEDATGAALPDGEKDKDALLWKVETGGSAWKPVRTQEVDIVTSVEFANGVLRMQKMKCRVIMETESSGQWSDIVTFKECEGYGNV